MKHLYVHIPFCRSRCAYCDFASEPFAPHARAGRVAAYVEALRAELALHEASLAPPLDTIYLGGGTPTVLPAEALLELATGLAALQGRQGPAAAPEPPEAPTPPPTPGPSAAGEAGASAAEFTIEANPGTIDAPLLARLRDAGVTRLSLGVQSFAPELRRVLGRRVAQAEIEASLAAIRQTGWEEWNLDLVFGIPGQTWEAAAADIDAALRGAPTHISLYDLTYPRAFAEQLERTIGAEARPAAAAFAEEHYGRAVARLERAGYHRYEISNFALPGHECRHNLGYWSGEDYLGIGVSAVSTCGVERRTNPAGVAAYLAGEEAEIEALTPRVRTWERAMLGLRTTAGVDLGQVLPALDVDQLGLLLSQGCLEEACGRIRVNPGYMDVCSSVLAALLLNPEAGSEQP